MWKRLLSQDYNKLGFKLHEIRGGNQSTDSRKNPQEKIPLHRKKFHRDPCWNGECTEKQQDLPRGHETTDSQTSAPKETFCFQNLVLPLLFLTGRPIPVECQQIWFPAQPTAVGSVQHHQGHLLADSVPY